MSATGMGSHNRRLRRLPWPLLIGIVLVFLVAILAVKGPDWAPRDPLERTNILRVGDRWEVPPYSFFTPGFPLGSDQFGRDLLSQLLWAVRPTMILVLIVAAVRLLVGVLVGLITGWSNRWYSRLLDLAIAFGLAVPVLLVSLMVVARMGLRHGVWTFIIALAVTGWVETAQYVRDQTRLLKEQLYVEAAHALGSPPAQILRQHILRQIIPLLSILAVFEISATLMVTAELGFLGFYLGGGVFIQIDDFTTRAGLGMPELGQMLAVGLDLTTEPFGLVVAGTVIFITILGFNLIGQGLRQRLSLQRVRRRTFLDHLRERFGLWLDEHIFYPMSELARERSMRIGSAALLVLVLIAGAAYILGDGRTPSNQNGAVETPLLPPTATGPAEVTALPNTATPTSHSADSAEVLWQYPTGGLPTPPIVGDDGTIYLLTHENILIVLEADGSLRWQQELSPAPHEIEAFNAPKTVLPPQVSSQGVVIVIASDLVYALDGSDQRLWEASLESEPKEDGCCAWNQEKTDFYLLDRRAGLYAFNAQEGFKWKYTPEQNEPTPQSSPLAGHDGRVYYSASGIETAYLFAVEDAGKPAWVNIMPEEGETGLPFLSFDFGYAWLRLDPQAGQLFFNQDIFDAADGTILETSIEGQLSQLASETGVEFADHERFVRFFAEEDGSTYMITSDPMVAEVQIDAEGARFIRAEAFQEYYIGIPPDRAGVAEGRYLWMEFETFPFAVGAENEAGLGILWMDLESDEERTLFVNLSEEQLAGQEGSTARFYVCDAQRDPPQVTCRSESIRGGDPEWQIKVEGIASIKYANLDLEQERLYLFGRDNVLYVVGYSE